MHSHVHLITLALCLASIDGVFRFANYYQDHMVLQRAPQRAIIWGYVDASDRPIVLTLGNKNYHTRSSMPSVNATSASIWSVTLDPQTEDGPFQVNVTRRTANGTLETIILNDVLFGDVWICSGQSNMEFALEGIFNASVEIYNAYKHPKIRLFTVLPTKSDTPQEELLRIALPWSIPTNSTARSQYNSAVCWLYGRMVQEALGGRPIGLVLTSLGNTRIEDWSPPSSIKECNITVFDDYHQSESEAGVLIQTSILYNAMIYPLTRMVIRGMIWYQGENNALSHYNRYTCSFTNFIKDLRSIWYTRTNSTTDPTFPFGFVQLSTNTNNSVFIGGFPWIRWHQTFDVGFVPNKVVPNVFMAVALDMRDDARRVHPRNKLDVGYRLSRAGLAVAYGFNNISYLGPIITEILIASDSSHINVTYSSTVSPAIELRNPNGFEVCCLGNETCKLNEKEWVATPASRIVGSPLTISLAVPDSCVSKRIDAIRYLWRETPCLFKQAAIYNSDDSDLPAPPYIHFF